MFWGIPLTFAGKEISDNWLTVLLHSVLWLTKISIDENCFLQRPHWNTSLSSRTGAEKEARIVSDCYR